MAFNPKEWAVLELPASRCFKIFIIIMMSSVALSAKSATLRFNPTPDDDEGGILFNGPVQATIVQSAAGMDIIVPGVTFTLQCQGDPTTSCTVLVDNGSSVVSNADNVGDTNDTVDSANGGDSSADGDCAGRTGFGAQYGCDDAVGDGGSSDSSGDESNDDGYTVDKGDDAEEADDSDGGWGLSPSTGSGEAPTRSAFPASNRIVYSSAPDVGSASADAGRSHEVELGLDSVTVLPLTMSSTPMAGGISYADTTRGPTGSDIAVWISNAQDGDAINDCSAYGAIDGQLRVSTQSGSTGCVLAPGGSYFLNVAACVQGDPSDYACRRNALTGYEGGYVILTGRW